VTTTQRLTWIALPWNRTTDGRLRVTAFLSPRLATDAAPRPTLGEQFHDFLDWPAIAGATEWTVALGGGATRSAQKISAPPESTLWKQLFPKETYVRPFVFRDHSVRRLRSYPVRAVLAYARDLYRDVARTSPEDLPGAPGTPGAHPGLEALATDLGGLLGVNEKTLRETNPKRLTQARSARLKTADSWGLDLSGAGTNPTQDFAAAQRFFERPELRDDYLPEPDANLIPPPPTPPDIDFHQMLGLLADHPSLLRRLGLAVDLAIEGDIADGTGTIRVVPAYTSPHPNPVFGPPFRPWTAHQVAGPLFCAEPSGPDLDHAMLRLEGAGDALDLAASSAYDLVQVDSDGAALRLVATASTLQALRLARPRNLTGIDTPDEEGLPTLRSGGLSVVRSGRALTLAKLLVDTKSLDAQTDENAVVLVAEDVNRGYRLDVEQDGKPWHSLHHRVGNFELHGTHVPPQVHDEGYVKSTSATSADDKDSDLHVHEALARWSGWSLAAERPGRLPYAETTTVPGEQGHPDRVVQEEQVRERGAADLATQFKLEARYNVEPGSLPRLRFGSKYRIRARTVDLAGNSLDIKEASDDHASDAVEYLRYEPVLPPDLVPLAPFGEGESLQRLVVRSNWDEAAEGPCERHVAAPKTSQFLAELLGQFDAAIGKGLPHDGAFAVAAREGALLSDAPGSAMHPGPAPPPDWPADRDPPGTYLVNPERSLALPYLPDPLSRGASLRGLPGSGAEAIRHSWGTHAWPDAQPFILQVVERDALPESVGACVQTFAADGPRVVEWDDDARVLTVRLEKGEVRTVRLSSYLEHRDLGLLGVWRWAEGSPDDDALARSAVEGAHWMLTPFRTLVLVHAVKRPLCAPKVSKPPWPDEFFPDGLRAQRPDGATYADLSCGLIFSSRTSGQIDVDATWKEPVDELVEDEPVFDRGGKGHVATVPVPEGLPPSPNAFPFHLEKQHRRPEPVRHEFGDTKHRYVQYRLTATTRFREYFPRDTNADDLRVASDVVNVHVPSCARPDPPSPRYAVPTFRWQRMNTPDDAQWRSTQRVREGCALRVYLDRGWYSSGADELLGVVCWTAGGSVPPEQTKLFSQVGRDPIWAAEPPNGVLTTADVANAARTETGLWLAELGSVASSVAGIEPTWDSGRKRWYADVLLPGPAWRSYSPFVRLALARYQHFSTTAELKLSRVVTLDFAQLIPDRTLRVDWVGDSDDLVDISLAGVAPDGPNLNRVEVTIEHHDGAIPGELGWRPWPDLRPIVLDEGVRHPGRFLEHLHLSETVQEALGLRRLFDQPGEHRHDPIDVGHLPTVSRAQVERLNVIPSWIELQDDIPLLLFAGHHLWSARVKLPVRRGSRPLRLVVREFETYETDAEAVGSSFVEPRTYHARRVVFAEFVEL
jgi:hypothetical protein